MRGLLGKKPFILSVRQNLKVGFSHLTVDQHNQSPLWRIVNLMEKKVIYLPCRNRIFRNNTHFEALPMLL